MTTIAPGATIAFLGGGQLARLSALAARALGYGVRVLDPDPRCAAAAVADEVVVAPFDDVDAAARLARGAAVVTFEIERIAVAAAEAAARHAPVRPSPAVLGLVQDRERQKDWLARHGLPLGPYALAADAESLARAVSALGGVVRAKSRRGGYDGRAQLRLAAQRDASGQFDAAARQRIEQAAAALGPSVVERELDLAAELSVLVARRPSGQVAVHPVARNWHVEGVLDANVIPAELPPALLERAVELAVTIANALDLAGVLVVEMFWTTDGALFVNELAPRPHNTFHASDGGATTSQFEQLVRAICDLPLGSTDLVRPTALANLLGDLWLGPDAPDVGAALGLPGVRLVLYGKEPRRGRKLGHLLASARTGADALAAVRAARERITPRASTEGAR